MLAMLASLAMLGVRAAPANAQAPYVPRLPPLLTPWTDSVSTTSPLPDYPRPELERARWMNLNGRWQYEAATPGMHPPYGQTLAETILVPFPVQSPLSGIERADTTGWYRRLFAVPAGWRGERVMLNFGAVTWAAAVYVNGRLVGTHRGSYGAFSFDITSALRAHGPNELLVGYANPMGLAGEPIGKQRAGILPAGISHTASSGIWQTVWLEPVASSHVTAVTVRPDLTHQRAEVRVDAVTRGAITVQAQALAGSRVVASARGGPGRTLTLRLPHARLWSPADPYLYDLRVSLVANRRVVDAVSSYFGMRSISLGYVAGHVRILLNGHFLFQSGALEQGFWPDGLYTAPTDAALRYDLLAAKSMGYNLVREHEKVEADRWYYWADRLGVLIWQDMPSPPKLVPLTGPSRAEFRRELLAMVRQLQPHPSIVTWVPFNEGWGQFAENDLTRAIRAVDPTRLVDSDSGSANCCAAIEAAASDIRDSHLYLGPFAVPSDYRASVVGEYGGMFPFPPAAHRWPGAPLSIGSPAFSQSPTNVIHMLSVQYADLAEEMRLRGLSAAVYTELGSYEQEEGILTYDRRAYSISPYAVRADNDRLIAASQQLAALRPQAPAIPTGATGIWTFEEGQGTTAGDRSGAGHTLTLEGGAGWTPGVRGGHALYLNRAGALAVATAPIVDTRRSFTVSVWLKAFRARESASAVSQLGSDGSSFSLGMVTLPHSRQPVPGEIASGRLAPAQRTYWTFAVPTLPSCTILTCGVIASTRYDDGRYSPAAGVWYQLTGVYDAYHQTTSVYVDGVPEDVEHPARTTPSTGPFTVGAGTDDYPLSTGFFGAVDDLRTYARALTPAEVWSLYAAEKAGAP